MFVIGRYKSILGGIGSGGFFPHNALGPGYKRILVCQHQAVKRIQVTLLGGLDQVGFVHAYILSHIFYPTKLYDISLLG